MFRRLRTRSTWWLASSKATPAGERHGDAKEMVAISVPMVMSAAKYARDDHRSRLARSSATTGTANDTVSRNGEVR